MTFSGGIVRLEVVVDTGIAVIVLIQHPDGQLGVQTVQTDARFTVQQHFTVRHVPRHVSLRQLVAVQVLINGVLDVPCKFKFKFMIKLLLTYIMVNGIMQLQGVQF